MKIKRLKPIVLIMIFAFSFSLLELIYLPIDVHAYGDDNPIVVVSMGDSYSAGEGIEPFYGQTNSDGSDMPRPIKIHSADWFAHRSTKSWPSLLKIGDLNVRDYKKDINGLSLPSPIQGNESSQCEWYFVAATGAVTDNFDNPYPRGPVKTRVSGGLLNGKYIEESDTASELAPQLDVFEGLYGKVDYVTMTIGGNDLGFSEIVINSVKYTAAHNPTLMKNLIAQKRKLWFTEFEQKLKDTYKKVYDAAGPQADIIVAGYPELYYRDASTWAAGKEQRKIIDDFVVEFCDKDTGRIKKAIDECNLKFANGKIHYVSVIEEFRGHGSDAPNGNEWINGITLTGTQMIDESDITQKAYPSMHPNEEGAKAYARCVNDKIQEIEEDKLKCVVSGEITDENGNSIIGVKVTLTDSDGNNYGADRFYGGYSFRIKKEHKTYTLTFEKNGYVTQTKTIIDVAEDRTVNVKLKKEENIPDDATVFNGHSYHIYSNFTWEEAEAYCESVGGHLVTITSQEEMNFITNELMNNTTNENCYWIGLQRDGDSWKWVTGEEFSYQNWAANEPNNYENKGENYVHLFGKEYTEGNGTKLVGTWNDVTNEGASYAADFYDLSNFGYICEWDTVNSNSNRNMYAQYFTIEPVVSKYGSSMIDEYGARLVVNDGAKIRKCAMYLKETNGVWRRTLAFVGDNITSAKYVPYVAYKGEILYDGLNSSGITVDSMSPDSSGIWNMHGYYYMQTADLQDNQGNYLTLRSTSVVGNNLQIFDDLDQMKEWLLS